ncbi:2-hydroxyacid dehydrogenase [Paenibacillus sp. GCM10027626]|uniref:2-hydroxyacid dehydrogenase n=1 Tax=Paenibacillus sp. GCM10027626 TaxID=3273411 RepID=UPI00363CE0EA
MSKPKVLVIKTLSEEARQYLSTYCEIDEAPPGIIADRDALKARLAGASGLLQSGVAINEELLAAAPGLKIVSNISVGYNNYDIQAMKARGVMGTNTPYVLDDTVADLIVGLMISAARRLPELDAMVKRGEWGELGGKSDEPYFGLDVHHATLGIIGMGRIGEAVAKRAAHGFDMKVLYSNRNRKPEAEKQYGAEYRTMEQLLQQSDFIIIMTPLTPETHRMIGKEQFDMMKRTAILINASRGQIIDEPAMIAALQQKRIFAAGLDVFEQEPVAADNPLLQLPNVVTLPHIGSATARTRHDMLMAAARNLVAGITGQRPPNLVPELAEIE